MAAMSALSLPPSALAASAAGSPPTAEELAKRGQIAKTAQDFEASFLSVMLQSMLKGVEQQAPFGGGTGEEMFKSFMAESMAKQMTKAGGIGLADSVHREMLKMQGLEP
jgi:peptidoglycan hydrolase FlgJ